MNSLLDNDAYYFTMGQFIWKRYPYMPINYKFTNRTKGVNLDNSEFAHILDIELKAMEQLEWQDEEIEYLGSLGFFRPDYLKWLKSAWEFPEVFWDIDEKGLNFDYHGNWGNAVFWETPFLAAINRAYTLTNDNQTIRGLVKEGNERLSRKLSILKKNPQIKFSDFGTRRRFGAIWHDAVLNRVFSHIPESMIGTSNLYFARKYDIKPIGTMAHQLMMVSAAIYSDAASQTQRPDWLFHSQLQIMDEWKEDYPDLAIALIDTYGTDFMLQKDYFKDWKGFRQDSGDPFEIGDKYIEYWNHIGVDPLIKQIVFSDGLNVDTMIALEKYFSYKTNISFGWGTNLTNDMGNKPLSIVIKPSTVTKDRIPVVKLSDNKAKATGTPSTIQAYVDAAKYISRFNHVPRY